MSTKRFDAQDHRRENLTEENTGETQGKPRENLGRTNWGKPAQNRGSKTRGRNPNLIW